MMNNDAPQNPYLPDELSIAPFAGRQQAYARLHQHLTGPARSQAILYMGRRHIGKTALLRHFDATFDEHYIGVYVPLKEVAPAEEAGWLTALANACAAALDARGFSLARLSEPTPPDDDVRAWLHDTYFLDVAAIIRPTRRLVFLLDDVDTLMDSVGSKTLPPDTFAFLAKLLESHPQVGMALTVDSRRESNLDALTPLVNALNAVRLTGLTLDESALLLRDPVKGMYALSDESVAAIHRATGGHPQLVQSYGFHLFRHWQDHPDGDSSPDSVVKTLALRVYGESEPEFRAMWQALTRDERLVLTALSSLLYSDPLRKIDTASIQAWLVDTDYPTDMTTINAAIRSLDYDQIVSGTAQGIVVTAGLMQKWLLENARLGTGTAGVGGGRSRASVWIIVAVVIVVLGLIALALAIPRAETTPAAPIPTVTLPP